MSEPNDPWPPDDLAITGPFASAGEADEAVRKVLAAHDFTVTATSLAGYTRGQSIVRIQRIGAQWWVSTSADLVAALGCERILAIDVDYGETGNCVTAVEVVELRRTEDGLVVGATLGSFPDERDALEATLAWQVRWLSRESGLDTEEAETRYLVFEEKPL